LAELYTLSLHDALPICGTPTLLGAGDSRSRTAASRSERSILKNSGLTEKVQPEAHGALHYTPSSPASVPAAADLGQLEQLAHDRSEEHTSELQSRGHLV